MKLKPYYHSDTCSDSDDVIDSVTLSLSHDSDSDASISTDDVDDDFTSTYSQYSDSDTNMSHNFYSNSDTNMSHDFYSDSDTNMSHDFYSDSNSLSTTSTTNASLSSSTVGSSHSDIDEASVAEQNDLKVTYTVAELLPVAENLSNPGFKRRSTWSHHSNKSQSKKVINSFPVMVSNMRPLPTPLSCVWPYLGQFLE